MASKRFSSWSVVTVLVGLFVVFLALPAESKKWAPQFLQNFTFHLGLDLAGGTQLDFRISEAEMLQQIEKVQAELKQAEQDGASDEITGPLRLQLQGLQAQQQNVIEAIRTVLERRINALGVSEAVITPSYIGNEKHLLVECPGIIDTQECIKNVGKTIQLEFKEELTEQSDEHEAQVRAKAAEAMRKITASGMTLLTVGQELSTEIGVAFQEKQNLFSDQLPKGAEGLWTMPAGKIFNQEVSVEIQELAADGTPMTRVIPGIFIAEVVGEKTMTGRLINEAPTAFTLLDTQDEAITYKSHSGVLLDASIPARITAAIRAGQPGELKVVEMDDSTGRVIFIRGRKPGSKTADVSHILVAYEGALEAPAGVTRTKEEALAKAQDLKKQLDGGASFEGLARTQSDGASAARGGKVGAIQQGEIDANFSTNAFALKIGQLSQPIETKFGYHIIRADKDVVEVADRASYEELIITGTDAAAKAQTTLQNLQEGKVVSNEEVLPIRSLFFSLAPTGWKDTLLDGKHFRSAAVTTDGTGLPVVQITFDAEGAKMFQELTKNNINKRIAIFVGGQLVSAPTVQTEITGGTAIISGSGNFQEAQLLAQDLNTGAIPAPIFLAGQRTVEPTLGEGALRTSLFAALIGTLILMAYMIVMYRLLGLIADLTLLMYALLLIAILKLPLFFFSSTYIVLTLAGFAGIILSIGMAVDANVLIFERIIEELRRGKSFKTAVDIGFKKAWPSIRDGNASTLITCAILFIIGTSIIRGFAITLTMGLFLSMFTAIIVTKWFVMRLSETSLIEKRHLFARNLKPLNEEN